MLAQNQEVTITGPPRAPGRSVLLVEDEAPLRMILSRNLARHGYHLVAVDSVGDAIARMMAHIPEVIVLDVNLPDGTGWEVLRWLTTGRGALTCSWVP